MKYTYTCKKIPLSDSIKTYAEKRLEKQGMPWRTKDYEAEPQEIHLGSGKSVKSIFIGRIPLPS